MVRSREELRREAFGEEPRQVSTGVRSRQALKDELAFNRPFAQGIDRVMQEQAIQKFTANDEVDEDAKYRLANSLYIANSHKIPFDQAYQNYDGVVDQMFKGKKITPKQVFEKIQWQSMTDKQRFDTYHKNTPAWEEFKGFFKSRYQRGKQVVSGLTEMATDISTKIHPNFGDELNQWSVDMRDGIQEYMSENPGEFLSPPGDGFWDTTWNYIKHPEVILGGVAEQVPLILSATVSSGTAGVAAKALGASAKATKVASFVAGTQAFAIPITGEKYSSLRANNIAPMAAIPTAILSGQSEGILEEWTRLFNMKLFHGSGGVARKGMGETIAKYLLDKPKSVKAGYYAARTYGQGFAEEGLQTVSDNFWNMVFVDPDQELMEGALNSGAGGGILELVMGESFRLGGKAMGNNFVDIDEQLARVEVIRDNFVNSKESPLNQEQKEEWNKELDAVREKVEEGNWTTPEDKLAENLEQQEAEDKAKTPQGQGEVELEAAFKLTDGRIIKTGAIHWLPENIKSEDVADSGFVRNDTGEYLTREEASVLAGGEKSEDYYASYIDDSKKVKRPTLTKEQFADENEGWLEDDNLDEEYEKYLEAQPTPQGQGEVVTPEPTDTPRYGIEETDGGWVVKDYELDKVVSRPNTDRVALKKAQFMNENPEEGSPDDTVSPNLYIGNVTQRMKRKVGGKDADKIQGFKEGAFPTKRTPIEMTRQEAIEYLEWLENDIERRITETETDIVNGEEVQRVKNLNSENDIALLRADYKDTKEIRKALGYPDVSQPFKIHYKKDGDKIVLDATTPLNKLKKQELTDIAEGLGIDTQDADGKALVKKDLLSAIEKHIAENETTAQKAVQEAIDAVNARATVVKTRKEVIKQVTTNESNKKVTIKQALNAVMKGMSKAATKAHLEGAKELQQQHHDLSRLINQLLDGVDVTPSQRAKMMDAVAKTRTETSQINAIALASKLRADAVRKHHTNTLKQLVRKVNRMSKKDVGKGGFLPEFRDKVKAVVNSFLTTEISPKQRAKLEALKDDINTLESLVTDPADQRVSRALFDSYVPVSLKNGLSKLNLKPISKMALDEIIETINTLNELIRFNEEGVEVLTGERTAEVVKNIEAANADADALMDKASRDNIDNDNYDPNRDAWYRNWYNKARNFLVGAMNHDLETLGETLSNGRNTLWGVTSRGLADGRYNQSQVLNQLDAIRDRIFTQNDITKESLQDISSSFYSFVRNKTARKKLGLKETPKHKVTLGGKEKNVEMGKLISIYMHSLAHDFNLPEMIKAGVAFPKELLGKITRQELVDISKMVESDKTAMAIVQMVQEQTQYLKDEINKVSQRLLGRDLANDDNHFHVERYHRGGVSGKEVTVQPGTVKNLFESLGYLQERQGSKDPIVIRDVFEVILAEQQAVTEYIGLAEPLRMIKTVVNDRTLRQKFLDKGYADELKYFDTIVGRIEGHNVRIDDVNKFISYVTGGLTRSVLANPGIMLGQRASTIGFFTEANHKYKTRLKTNYNKESQQKYKDNIPWLKRRIDQGLTSVAIYEIAKSDLALRAFADKTSTMNNLLRGINFFDTQAMMDGAHIVEAEMADDNLSGKSLEYWTESGVDPSSLEVGSEAYWKAFSDRMYYMVSRTQPMFFTENRSYLTSTEQPLSKSFFLFRSYVDQPLRIAFRTFQDKQTGKISSKTFAKQLGTVWASLAAYEVIRFAVDKAIFRSDDDEKDLFINSVTSPLKLMPVVGRDTANAVKFLFDAYVKGERKGRISYGVSSLAIQGISDIIADAGEFARAASYIGSNERLQSGDDKGRLKSEVYLERAVYELTKDVLKYSGIPSEVIEDLIKGKGEGKKKKGKITL